MKAKVLVMGCGGREHALAWKIAQSDLVGEVKVMPGNAGISDETKISNITSKEGDDLVAWCKSVQVDLVVIGPEALLAVGTADLLRVHDIPVFGPSKQGAQLETSKVFCKSFLERNNIPTAKSKHFCSYDKAIEWCNLQQYPLVIKADDLAAGKGVTIAENEIECQKALKDILVHNVFNHNKPQVLVEEFIYGEEVSFIYMYDGKNYLDLASSQDHKAAFDGDSGPNTGGMGAYSPAPIVSESVYKRIQSKVVAPTIAGLQREGIDYCGFLYAGLMIDSSGEPKVLEYNCRLGDPEAQVLLFRLKSDLFSLLLSAVNSELSKCGLEWEKGFAVGVVLASQGYPGSYEKGNVIDGLEDNCLVNSANNKVFHSATVKRDNLIISNGGRILSVVSQGEDFLTAQQKVYSAIKRVACKGTFYRKDIGNKALKWLS